MVYLKFILTCCCKDSQIVDQAIQDVPQKPKPYNETQKKHQSDLSGLTIAPHQIQMKSQPKLKLAVIQSESFPKDYQFMITTRGLQDSQQQPLQQGCVFIGLDEKSNDIVLRDSRGVGERHCMILYEKFNQKFLLKDLGEGNGSFVKICQPLELEEGNIICIGENLINVSFSVENPGFIQMKFIQGQQNGMVLNFGPQDEVVSFGRMADSKIQLNDASLSRYHCVVYWENQRWKVNDGDGIKESTNGTWLFSEESMELFQNSVVKIGQSLFRVDIQWQYKLMLRSPFRCKEKILYRLNKINFLY